MLLYIAVILLGVSLIMTVGYIRNLRRPKTEGRIIDLVYQPVRNDRRADAPRHKHGKVTFLYEGREYEATVLLWAGGEVGDRIILVHPPGNISKISVYAPGRYILRLALLYLVGLVLLAVSFWVRDMLD